MPLFSGYFLDSIIEFPYLIITRYKIFKEMLDWNNEFNIGTASNKLHITAAACDNTTPLEIAKATEIITDNNDNGKKIFETNIFNV